MNVSRLTRANLHLAEKVFIARHQIGKLQLSSEQIEAAISSMRRAVNDKYIIHWGCFSPTNQFMGYLVQAFSSKVQGTWLMPFLATNPEIGEPWDYTKNGMDALWRTAMVAGRVARCENIVWSLPTAWTRAKDRTASKVWGSYEIVPFAQVPAGTLPELPFDRWVFGQNEKPYDVTLRCAWSARRPEADLLQALRAPIAESILE